MNTIQHNIAKAFLELGKKNLYRRLPNFEGNLSTTFIYPVFAMPHMQPKIAIHGFNTAFRPTDNDEGLHLVSFKQYYICTNAPVNNLVDYITKIIKTVVKKTFPRDLNLQDIKLENGIYEWQADSTGYRGSGGEINVTSIKIAGKRYKLGRLEIAQVNDYDTSGDVKGNRCHLLVFGIDRLVTLCLIAQKIKKGEIDNISSMTIQELYNLSHKTASQYKGLADTFLTTPINTEDMLKEIHKELLEVKKMKELNGFSMEAFQKLRYICSLTECAYAANMITRDLRRLFIREQRKLYKHFVKHIIEYPELHTKLINQTILQGEKEITFDKFFKDAINFPSFFLDNFKLKPRGKERVLQKELINNELHKKFLGELGIFSSNTSPVFLLKQNMFIRAVGEDLSQNIEKLAKPVEYIHTLTGTIKERLQRINSILDFLKKERKAQLSKINIDELQKSTRYLALDWRYFSVKIYPALEGLLGGIALKQQGYNKSLADRVIAFHTADKPNALQAKDPITSLLILVGMLDEAVFLYRYFSDEDKTMINNDPYGIRQKIGAAIDASINLGLSTDDIYELLKKVISLTPSAKNTNMESFTNYFIRRMSN